MNTNIFMKFLKQKELINLLDNCYHSYQGNPNPYHLEDNTLTHTMMVFNSLSQYADEIDQIAALFHDAGKPICRYEKHEKQKTAFSNHEYASIQFVIDFLVKEKITLSDVDFESLVLAINNHLNFFQVNTQYKISQLCNFSGMNYMRLNTLAKADNNGRITEHDKMLKNFNDPLVFSDESFKIDNCNIVFFGGIPGSGKDYVAENANNFGMEKFDYIFSWDDIRVEEYMKNHKKAETHYNKAQIYNNAWKWCNDKKIDLNKILKEKINNVYSKDIRIAICNTFCNKKGRAQVFNILPHGVKVGSVHVFTSMDTAINRDSKRDSRNLGIDIIKKFSYCQVLPTMEESFHVCKYMINE